MRKQFRPFSISLLFIIVSSQMNLAQTISFSNIEKLPQPQADHRIAYGNDPLQFGDLRLPKSKGKHPIIIVIHGGCWFAQYDLQHLNSFCEALTRLGAATWSLEYRRIGNDGGGFPGTFQDVAQGVDFLRTLAKKYPLDLKCVIVIGHSAGGQLALWLAARKNLPQNSVLYMAHPLPLNGVISLAGITDLRKYRPDCDDAVTKLPGGVPEQFAVRYQRTSPIELLPLKIPVRLIYGAKDKIVPLELGKEFAAAAKKKGDEVTLTVLEDVGHFELISPQAKDWSTIREIVFSFLRIPTHH